MYHYRYSILEADLDYNIKKHPQQDLLDRGLNYIKSEPFSIADCWIFRFNHILDNPPPYLIRISDDFKFSDEGE